MEDLEIDLKKKLKIIECKDEWNTDIEDRRIQIYRYEFTKEFMNLLFEFSKIHQYDDRKVFKEEWKKWIKVNKEQVDNEVIRLNQLQYDGNVLDKMFRSARYYFRKKQIEKKDPKKRISYKILNKEILNKMDKHVIKNKTRLDYKPANGFLDFCKINQEILQEEIKKLKKEEFFEEKEIEQKLKKTYKNRYFIQIH
jgi:hypothetical protein